MRVWYIVNEQDGRESQSTVPIGEHERSEQIKLEASLHLFSGWAVTLFMAPGQPLDESALFDEIEVDHAVMVSDTGVVRRVWCRAADPSQDGASVNNEGRS